MRKLICIALWGALSLQSAQAATVMLSGAPAYLWYGGCGPTAAGMVMGYWDNHGLGNLISAGNGSSDWAVNEQPIKDTIASSGYFRDYYNAQPDTPAPHHADDCIADYLGTSRDPLAAGETYESWMSYGMVDYAKSQGYSMATAGKYSYSVIFWDFLTSELNAGRPMVLFVDSNADGTGDHFVEAIGYEDAPVRRWAAYNTYDLQVHWYTYGSASKGREYGVRSGTWFRPEPIPGDANADGVVDFSDYIILESNFGKCGNASQGDFTGDGKVDFDDYLVLESNFGVAAAVPEPTTMTIICLAAVAIRTSRGGQAKNSRRAQRG